MCSVLRSFPIPFFDAHSTFQLFFHDHHHHHHLHHHHNHQHHQHQNVRYSRQRTTLYCMYKAGSVISMSQLRFRLHSHFKSLLYWGTQWRLSLLHEWCLLTLFYFVHGGCQLTPCLILKCHLCSLHMLVIWEVKDNLLFWLSRYLLDSALAISLNSQDHSEFCFVL